MIDYEFLLKYGMNIYDNFDQGFSRKITIVIYADAVYKLEKQFNTKTVECLYNFTKTE